MRDNGLRGSTKPSSLSYRMFGVGWSNLTRQQRLEYDTEWRRRNSDKVAANRKKHRERNNAAALAKLQDPTYRYELNKRNREWRAANGTKANGYCRKYRLKKEYGLTVEEYDAMVLAQGGKCAICGATRGSKIGSKRDAKLNIDHDHQTGKVRGLLCHNCNMVLGHLDDDIERMYRAIEYLRAYRQSEVA